MLLLTVNIHELYVYMQCTVVHIHSVQESAIVNVPTYMCMKYICVSLSARFMYIFSCIFLSFSIYFLFFFFCIFLSCFSFCVVSAATLVSNDVPFADNTQYMSSMNIVCTAEKKKLNEIKNP